MNVSICIPTYNRPDFLKDALESCFSQTKLPYEIIIGDDSKNDECKNVSDFFIAEKKDVIIKYKKNIPALGQLANVNSLIEQVTGDKFVLLHDDDLLLPNALQTLSECFEKQDVDVVYGKQYIITENGEIKNEGSETLNKYYFRIKEFEGSKISSLEAAIVQQFPNDCYMIESTIAKKMKYGKKEDVGNAGDFDFGFRLGQASYRFYFVNQYTAKYRLSKESVGRNGTDSGYQSYKLIRDVTYTPSSDVDYRTLILQRKAPMALMQAIKRGYRKDAFAIYFSKYHIKKIFTLGGMRRLLHLLGKW